MPGLDVRVTVYAPNFASVTCLDAYSAGDLNGGSIQYEDTPSGCGAGKISLGLRYEEMKSRGYWRGMSIVEISSGDNTLKTSAASGANKYYLDTTWGFDPAQGEDAQQAYFYDGATLTMKVPVTGVGTDAGGAYITTGAPLGGGSVPAYTAGTIVGRRRYTGRITRRQIAVQRLPGAIDIQLTGLTVAFTQAVGTFTITTAANVDVGSAIYNSLAQFQSSHWPFLAPIVSTNFPTTGNICHLSLTNVGCDSLISNALQSIASADQWFVRVGHDRVPRLVKLFTQSTNSYTYNVTLTQGALEGEPVSISLADEDSAGIYNSILVTGDTDPTTNQPVTAIVQDPTAAAFYGFQIDGSPISNQGLKDVTGAANYGLGQVDENALPISKNQVVAFTKNDTVQGPTPGGMQAGDLVRASTCLTVAGFDQTGLVPNSAPDAGMQYIAGTGALWSAGAGSLVVGGSPDGYNAWSIPANGVAQGPQSPKTPAAPNQTWTFAGFIDPSAVTGTGGVGTVQWYVGAYDKNGTYLGNAAFVSAAMGAAAGTTSPTTFVTPASTASLVVFMYVQGAAGRSGSVKFAQPNLVQGASIKPYVVNLAAPNVYGLPSSVVTTIDFDKHDSSQAVSFAAIEPDFSAALDEAANAVSTALRANAAALNSIDSYCVSSNARNYTVSATSLNVTFPALLAIWAPSSSTQAPTSVPLTTVTCTASASNWVWLLSNGSYAVYQTATPVQGAILMAIFQMSAAGWLGDSGLKASVGVMQIGYGNINASSSIPAPTVSAAPTISNGASISGLAAAVDVSLALNNVPTDGSVSQILWLYRQSVASGGSGTWLPFEAQNLTLASGSKYPLAAQTQSFEYDLNNGTSYDFAVAYYGLAGFGQLLYVYAGWTVKAIGIPNAYMLGGTSSPTVSSGSATPTASNGLKAAMALAFTITNQPTDGSLSRITVWYTNAAVPGVWVPIGSFAAYGVGTSSPPASHAYTFGADNLVSGTTYGFGVTFENGQGGDTPTPTQFATATAQTITITQQYLIGNASPTPIVTAVAGGIGSSPTLPGVASRVALNFSVSNQPVDGSFAGIAIFQKQHSAGTNSFAEAFFLPSSSLTTPNASGTYYCEIPESVAGIAYDYGFAFVNTQGAQSATLATPSFSQNYVAQAIAIQNGYMLGTSITPVVSGPSASNGTSADGVSAAVAATFTLTNQPTDGSLSRVQVWVRLSSAGGSNTVGQPNFNWSPYGAQQAVGVGTASPPAGAAYAFTLADVTNGNVIDIGVSYENAQGGESTLAVVASSFSANALNIPPGATTFGRLLTSQFYGLSIDSSTGLLVMPAGGFAIYPNAQIAQMGAIGVPATFKMRFEISNNSSMGGVSAAIFTDSGSTGNTFANGYYATYVPNGSGTPATINLYKKVSGTSSLLISRSAAIAGNTLYATVPAIPIADGYMHELKLVANAYSGSGPVYANGVYGPPAAGTTIQVFLDGVVVMVFSEATVAQTTTYGGVGTWLTYAGPIGGAQPFASGYCGPGGSTYFVYLDPADLVLQSSLGTYPEQFATQSAIAMKSPQAYQNSSKASPLATSTVARETQAGTYGHGQNLLFNPTAMRGSSGWTAATSDATGLNTQTTDQTQGGRFGLTFATGTHSAAACYTEWIEYVTSLTNSSTYTLSGFLDIGSLSTGAYATIGVTGLPSDTTGTTAVTYTAVGTGIYFTMTFTTGVNAFSTPYVYLQLWSGSNKTTTVASTANIYTLMFEQGAVATTYADSFSGAVVTQTHTAAGQIVAGLNSSTALKSQLSLNAFADAAVSLIGSTSHTNAATIQISWAAFGIRRADGTTISIPAGSSVAYTGFAGSTTYYTYAWFSLTPSGTYSYTTVTGGYICAAIYPAAQAPSFAQIMNGDGCCGIAFATTILTAPAPSSGSTSSNGSPHTPQCPAIWQLVETREYGFVRADELRVGDHVRDPEDGWNAILALETHRETIIDVEIGEETFSVEIGHLWLRAGGDPDARSSDWIATKDVTIATLVAGRIDGREVACIVRSIGNVKFGEYVRIVCERNRLMLGQAVAHNFVTQ